MDNFFVQYYLDLAREVLGGKDDPSASPRVYSIEKERRKALERQSLPKF